MIISVAYGNGILDDRMTMLNNVTVDGGMNEGRMWSTFFSLFQSGFVRLLRALFCGLGTA